MDYTKELCVTAGELRSIGIDIPEVVPDCAWIPRNSMRVIENTNITVLKDTKICFCHAIHFFEPFRWVEGNITI